MENFYFEILTRCKIFAMCMKEAGEDQTKKQDIFFHLFRFWSRKLQLSFGMTSSGTLGSLNNGEFAYPTKNSIFHSKSQPLITIFPYRIAKPAMKRFLLLLSVLCPAFLFAQNCPSGLAGTFKIGPSGIYHSIQEALDSLKSKGLSQSVILELQSTYNSSVESYPIRFPKISCVDSTKTVTLRPEAGATSLQITGGNDSVLIDFNNAFWFVIDGRSGGTGTTKQLTINNTNPNGSTIRLINDACFNSLKHLNIQGATAYPGSGTILIAGTGLLRGNDSNRVDSCNIYDGVSLPANAIFVNGTFQKFNTGLLINACNIDNFYSFNQGYANGISIGNNMDSVVIVNNLF
jgi:hypothetical protein